MEIWDNFLSRSFGDSELIQLSRLYLLYFDLADCMPLNDARRTSDRKIDIIRLRVATAVFTFLGCSVLVIGLDRPGIDEKL